MMKNIYKIYAKKLFGVRYERVGRSLLAGLILFLSLHTTGFRIEIAPSILYLMTAAFTAGIMWQALSSSDHIGYMKQVLMLPFHEHELVSAYISVLGCYTLVTKTAILWAVVFAVSSRTIMEILVSILCALNAILITGNIFSTMNAARSLMEDHTARRKPRQGGLAEYQRYSALVIWLLWGMGIISALFLISDSAILLTILFANMIVSVMLLRSLDAYSFYPKIYKTAAVFPARQHTAPTDLTNIVYPKKVLQPSFFIWRYLFRYLTAHKNYLANTAVMCAIACVLPRIFNQTDDSFILPIGCAILSMNTPLCILLSCDPALDQAVRFLPDQKKLFCASYCMFIFFINILVEAVFLCSLAVQTAGFNMYAIPTVVFFSLQSAVGSIWLEWFRPIRDWKIESDLWHHPRKYIVPLSMVLIAGIIGTMPWILYLLYGILTLELICFTIDINSLKSH